MRKTLGVIGGLGPMATAYFLELVTKMTKAASDQEHLHVLIDSEPRTPDRTGFLTGEKTEDPFPWLLKGGRNVKAMGAEVLAMPCNTAHAFYDRLQAELQLPFVHLIRETALVLREAGVENIGLMATEGTVKTGLYQRELERFGIRTAAPDAELQKQVHHVIFQNVKANLPPEMDRFFAVRDELFRQGAQVIVLGCTELSVVKKIGNIGPGFLDAMEVLAAKSVTACGAELAAGYERLISE
ncbi:MAG: aspartate/glutamate racemase family protein [Lachnospiraceae bacterium]|nr:aspartate/glutamate racemase family protein [Lachnospiraceae bacterium]